MGSTVNAASLKYKSCGESDFRIRKDVSDCERTRPDDKVEMEIVRTQTSDVEAGCKVTGGDWR